MKGIILAGGAGSRLYPITEVSSKQLQPIYDKPMIYYPLSTLMLAGIKEIMLISTPHDLPKFKQLLGDGNRLGISLEYAEQAKPNGIAQAFIIAEKFLNGSSATLILGDNIFYGSMGLKTIINNFKKGAYVFGYSVKDPERYGVVEFAKDGKTVIGLQEKPEKPKTNYAIPGLYIYDENVAQYAKDLKPSKRGELEITDLNLKYMETGTLKVQLLGRGIAWLDTGTHESMIDAANFIHTIEARQGLKIACLEEIAFRMGFIDKKKLKKLSEKMLGESSYKVYLENIIKTELR